MGLSEGWVVLRCHPGNTLRLADDLQRRAIAAWVPKLVAEARGRYARQPRRVVRPLLPSYVFVPQWQAGRLPGANIWPAGLPRFRPFKIAGRCVTVLDDQLASLRMIERQLRADPGSSVTAAAKPFAVGEQIRVLEGPFKDHCGTVEGWDGVYCQVHLRLSTAKFRLPPFLLERAEA